jgi:hypothetical protein
MRDKQAANLFDLRRIIGGLFVLYGLVLVILGIFAADEDIDRAAGLNINLIAGLGMLALGALFLLWAFTRPLGEQIGTEDPRAVSEEARGRAGGDDQGAVRSDDPGA